MGFKILTIVVALVMMNQISAEEETAQRILPWFSGSGFPFAQLFSSGLQAFPFSGSGLSNLPFRQFGSAIPGIGSQSSGLPSFGLPNLGGSPVSGSNTGLPFGGVSQFLPSGSSQFLPSGNSQVLPSGSPSLPFSDSGFNSFRSRPFIFVPFFPRINEASDASSITEASISSTEGQVTSSG